MSYFSMIVAVDSKMGIGKNNTIPWRLANDMKYFHQVTTEGTNNVVIMGRKTWESLPEKHRPLKDRLNIVLTRDRNYKVPNGVLVFESLEKVLKTVQRLDAGNIFIIGGEQIYKESIKYSLCKTIYLTQIEKDFDCDTFFPKIPKEFHEINRSEKMTENDVEYRYLVYERDI